MTILIAYAAALIVVLAINYSASVLSDNHNDLNKGPNGHY
jgi:hypothetical protein